MIELPHEWFSIGQDVSVMCQAAGKGDSWLAIQTGSKVLLNLNDCIYMSEDELWDVQNEIGFPIQTLFTQFSYASWWGNPEESGNWKAATAEQLAKIDRAIRVLQPAETVLSASYVYFCQKRKGI